MKNFAQFVFMYGAAVVVSLIMVVDLFRGMKSAVAAGWVKAVKWLTIAVLSLWQVACWKAAADFDSAFGASSGSWPYALAFFVLVLVWVVHQVVIHLLKRRRR